MSTQTIVKCAICSGLNAHGLPFCLYCGESLEGVTDVKITTSRACESCSLVDPLSQRYCTSCGVTMGLRDLLIGKKSTQTNSSNKIISEINRKNVSNKKSRKNFSNLNVPIAATIIGLTAICGLYSLSQYQFSMNTGILVHAEPIGTEVTIRDKHNFVAKSGSVGLTGEIEIKGLKPGFYDLSLSHVGYEPFSQKIQITSNKILALGIPESIHLMPLSKNNEIVTYSNPINTKFSLIDENQASGVSKKNAENEVLKTESDMTETKSDNEVLKTESDMTETKSENQRITLPLPWGNNDQIANKLRRFRLYEDRMRMQMMRKRRQQMNMQEQFESGYNNSQESE